MKHLRQFESFSGEPYWKTNSSQFNADDKSELFHSDEVVKISEILQDIGYTVELENIFYNTTENVNKVFRVKGKKTSQIANGDKYYKDDVVIMKSEDEYFDVYFAKITEIPDQSRLERLRGYKAIPITKITYYKADQFDGLEKLFRDIL